MSDIESGYRDFLRLLWQNGMLQRDGLVLSNGTSVEIVRPGTAVAYDEGGSTPDFNHAAIRYYDYDTNTETTLCGSIRIDRRSSDWRKAGTVNDAASDNVILHVVSDQDHILMRNEMAVRTLVVRPPSELSDLYSSLTEGSKNYGCVGFFTALDSLYQNQIISRVMSDRMNRKSAEILDILSDMNGDWHETAYIAFIKAFGYKESKIAYEKLARSAPYRHLKLHHDNVLSIQAMLLGQAGYLETRKPDEYTRKLRDEYDLLKRRYNLQQLPLDWRSVGGRRPASIPAQELAKIAVILAREESLMERVMAAKDIYDLISIFDIRLPEYWRHHYIPSHPSSKSAISYGVASDKIDRLILNFVIPFRIAYGIHTSDEELRDSALDLYEFVKWEENSITDHWGSKGFVIENGMVSQGLIQITVEYCIKGKCALCPLGAEQFRRLYKKLRL